MAISYQPFRTYLQDPTIASDCQPTEHAAVLIYSFGTSGKGNALVLQATQVLPIPTVDDARAPRRETACGERGKVGGRERNKVIRIRKWLTLICSTYRDRKLRSSRTGHSSNRVAHQVQLGDSRHSCYHLRSLGRCSAKDTNASRWLSVPSAKRLSKHSCTHPGLGADRLLLDICHVDGECEG